MSTGTETNQKRQLLAERLREAREYLGLSQDEVATALRLSRPAITNIESGTRKIEAVELEQLSRLYRQPLSYFQENTEPKESLAPPEFLARAIHGLSTRDVEEVARFASFLKEAGAQRATPKRKKP